MLPRGGESCWLRPIPHLAVLRGMKLAMKEIGTFVTLAITAVI
jgi:hypothetical protein